MHQNSHLVGKIEKVIVFDFPFQAHRVEIQIADIVQFGLLSLRR